MGERTFEHGVRKGQKRNPEEPSAEGKARGKNRHKYGRCWKDEKEKQTSETKNKRPREVDHPKREEVERNGNEQIGESSPENDRLSVPTRNPLVPYCTENTDVGPKSRQVPKNSYAYHS